MARTTYDDLVSEDVDVVSEAVIRQLAADEDECFVDAQTNGVHSDLVAAGLMSAPTELAA